MLLPPTTMLRIHTNPWPLVRVKSMPVVGGHPALVFAMAALRAMEIGHL